VSTPPAVRISGEILGRLYDQSGAAAWGVSETAFSAALERSALKTLAEGVKDSRRLERFLSALHHKDLALACACAEGTELAWDHFVREYRPVLYRSADALAPGGAARELADSVYAELFGLEKREGERRSLFRYYHGRSSLATWLRAVLAQRHIDRIRAERRLDPIDEDAALPAITSTAEDVDPDRPRFLALVRLALLRAIAGLADRDRLRLGCYYREGLTLAETGRVLNEHEATVSRQLARTRKAIRAEVERYLRHEKGLGDEQIATCFECTIDDPGPLDLQEMLGSARPRKDSEPERSL
jgi:RNA polymerase sigma-70 factor (ECF subfamily)